MKTKNIIVSGLILGSFLSPAFGKIAYAQVDTPATSAQIDDLKSTLISLLTQMIASLQAQIDTILAQQNAQTVSAPASNTLVNTEVAAPATQQVSNPVRILDFYFYINPADHSTWEIDMTTDRPIDPSLTQLENQNITVSNIRTLPVAANCSSAGQSSSQAQVVLCNGSRVRFDMDFNSASTTSAMFKFFGIDGTSVSRQLYEQGVNHFI